MIGTDGPLTDQEKDTLRTMMNSEVFRIARKAISAQYGIEAARLASTHFDANGIYIAQGRLQGLIAAYNLIMSGTVDKERQTLNNK